MAKPVWFERYSTDDLGVLYVLADPVGHFKVGMTTRRGLQQRIATLQIGNPFKLRVVYTALVDAGHIFEVEQTAHHFLKSCHVRGEWFRASQETILESVTAALDRTASRIPEPELSKVVVQDEVDDIVLSGFDQAMPDGSVRRARRRDSLLRKGGVI